MKGGTRLPLGLTALAVLVLVGIVAVASTGSTEAGTSDGRKPSEFLLDTFFSLMLLGVGLGAVFLLYGLTQRRAIALEIATKRYPRFGFAAFVVFILLFTLAGVFVLRRMGPLFGGDDSGGVVGPEGSVDLPERGVEGEAYQAEFTWIPVVVVLGLAAIAVAAYVLAARRRSDLAFPADVAAVEQLADVLSETLDDLRAEPDARRVVIAAFARLERALAASGVPRSRPETAQEYVARVLEKLEVDPRPIRILTELFTRAKFSHHDIDEPMKLEAIAALEQIRDDLREAVRRAQAAALEPTVDEQAAAP